MKTSHPEDGVSLLDRFMVLLAAVGFALRYGFNFGISNQNTYLLHGLKMARPGLLSGDWLAGQGTDYHPAFSYVVQWLYQRTPSGWSFALVNTLVAVAGALVMYRILADLSPSRYTVWAYLTLMGILSATGTFSVASSYLFANILQPSSLGALGFLIACFYFFRGNYLRSGLAWALGGVFHVNYLILGFPVFGLAHLLMGFDRLTARLIRHCCLPALALMPVLGIIWRSAGAPDALAGQMILFKIRSPHHYDPLTFSSEFVPFLGWLCLGTWIGWRWFPRPERWRAFRALFVAHVILIALGTVLTSVVFIPKVAQVYVYRLAPVVVLFAQMMLCVGLVRLMTEKAAEPRLGFLRTVVLAGVILAANAQGVYYGSYHLLAVSLAAVPFVSWCRRRLEDESSASHVQRPAVVFSLVVCLVGVIPNVAEIPSRSTLIKGLPPGEADLYRWAQTTPEDAIFLIPPGLENFRLHSERSVVIDWKSTPVIPEELVEWYRRIQTTCGIDGVRSLADAEAGYDSLGKEGMEAVRAKYPFDYAVFRAEDGGYGGIDDLRVFENGQFVVFARPTARP